MLEVCLSHDSASEEELMRTQNGPRAPSPGQTPDDIAASRENTNTEGASSNFAYHESSAGSNKVLKIRSCQLLGLITPSEPMEP